MRIQSTLSGQQRPRAAMATAKAPKLSAAEAGRISRLLWEYESFNRLRKLVNDLIESGVTLEQFAEFARLPAGGPQHLVVDVYNMLSHLQRDTTASGAGPRIEIDSECLHRIPACTIAKLVRRSIKDQQAVVAQAESPLQVERDR